MNMTEQYVDFHLHTTESDGNSSKEDTIRAAQKAGLSAIAITDHNCFALETPIMYKNLEVIPGAEFSTAYRYGNRNVELHIVGLFFQGVDLSLNSIFARINKMPYVKALVDKMNSLGNEMTMEEVIAQHTSSKPLGRHGVAEVLVQKGYAADIVSAMDTWVGNRSPHYINSLDYISYIATEECVRRICDSPEKPGLPVLAHPFHYNFSKKEIEEMVAWYRDITDKPLAMEVYYGKYSDKEIEYLEYLADKYNLLPSAGSDRHRAVQPFARGGYVLLENMKKAMQMEIVSIA